MAGRSRALRAFAQIVWTRGFHPAPAPDSAVVRRTPAGTEMTNKAGTTLTNQASASQTVDCGGMLTLKGGLVKIN